VLPEEPRQARPRRPLARGTNTSLIENRLVRLHAPGEKPWLGRADDHRDRINVEKHGDAFVVYKPSVGALSALSERDYIPFHVFMAAQGDAAALERYFVQMGATAEQAGIRAKKLARRLVRDGWMRTELPDPESPPLTAAYFTVTRYCDLGCPYCYQGLNDRGRYDEMSLDQARLVLQRIKAVNPACTLIVSGGEPFSHTRIHEILDLIDEHGFSFKILSNGSFIDERAARHLKTLKGFQYIQISLDGATAETHELTRGKGHFPKAMAGLRSVIDQGLPFKLAPTLHDGNMHELPAIGELALANGGWMSPNQLKELPHSGLNYTGLKMSNDRLLQALRQLNEHLVAKFGLAYVTEVGQRYFYQDPEVCSVAQPNSTFICGMAHSLMDVDWNGDVYPCHLSKGPELKIGNIFEEDFERIFQRVAERGLRVKSPEIEKCSGCKFVSNCAGGCRAGAWFTYGTLEHEDDICEVNYASNLSRLLVGAGVS
jgi:radical SAM protein with 4Fe4S-binding SPASM domain